MRKISMILAAALAAGFMSLAAPVSAQEPSSRCSGGEVDGVAKTGTDGGESVSVCGEGFGSITAAYKGGTSGYVVADGDSTNPDPSNGHIGVSDAGPGVVCGDGNYSYEESDGQCNPV